MAAPMLSIYKSAAILLVFTRCCYSEGLLPTKYEIDTLCDDILDMENENITSGTLKSSETSVDEYNSEDCWITILAPPGHLIVMRIIEVDINRHTDYICRGYVRLWDGSKNRTVLTDLLCNASNMTVKSSGRGISVHVKRENVTREKTINILFTSFHVGICEPEEFKCDNGYCIDGRLKCNGYNNCGDKSDMCTDYLAVIITVCGMAVFVGFLVFLIRLLIRQHNRVQFHKGGYVIKTASKETIPMTSPQPPPYVQPTAPNIPWADQSPENMPAQNMTNIPLYNLRDPPPRYEYSPVLPFPTSAKI